MKWLALVALLAAGIVSFVVFNVRKVDSKKDAPLPKITADARYLARGESIFHSMCEGCHRAPGAPRVNGAAFTDLPAAFGSLWAPNLTRDPVHGVGAMSDQELARVLRYGVTRSGSKTLMGGNMSDADIAGVIAFMRSDDAIFDADPQLNQPQKLSVIGKLVLSLTGAVDVADLPAEGIKAPTDGIALGRYLAHDVYDCAGCHTPGFDPKKGESPEAFTGGFDFNGIVSANLRRELPNFERSVREGVGENGQPLRVPMPKFSGMTDEELAAVRAYIKSFPAAPGTPAA